MKIDRQKFLLMATGLSQSLGCVPQSQPLPAGPHQNPYGQASQAPTAQVAPGPMQAPTAEGTMPTPIAKGPTAEGPVAESPRLECYSWNPRGECTEYEGSVAVSAADECSQWNPRGECVAWGTPLPADECNRWDPSGECTGWVAPAVPHADTPRDECVAWHPNGACSARATYSPTDECMGWSPTNECNRWIYYPALPPSTF